MDNENWTRWVMQTAETWEDIAPIIKNTGVDVIDHDHQKLIGFALELNKLINKMDEDKLNMVHLEEQHILLNNLYQYTGQHFLREEELMELYNIKDPLQIEQHEHILKMLKGFLDEFDAGRVTVSMDLKSSIMEWVVHHINEIDYKTFSIDNWKHILIDAKGWDDIKAIIKQTGIPVVDNEHRQLVECTLKFNDVLKSKKKKAERLSMAKEILKELKGVVENHFKSEEDLIKKYNMPNLKIQLEQHAVFNKLLLEAMGKSDEEFLKDLEAFKLMVVEWWINHINKLDFYTFSIALFSKNLIDHCKTSKELEWMIQKTGVSSIDDQHIDFLAKIAKIEKFLPSKKDKNHDKEIDKVFTDIISFAKEHFDHEEGLMKKEKAFLNDVHKEEHKSLLRQFEAMHQQHKDGLIVFSTHLKTKIINAWITHTNKIDIETFKEVNNV